MFRVVIPARYASTRLPGKALLPMAGKPMVQWVWERAGKSRAADVIVATDDSRIADAARSFGAVVAMTSAAHPSGTDRIAEVAHARGWAPADIVVNVQGDEPLIPQLRRERAPVGERLGERDAPRALGQHEQLANRRALRGAVGARRQVRGLIDRGLIVGQSGQSFRIEVQHDSVPLPALGHPPGARAAGEASRVP